MQHNNIQYVNIVCIILGVLVRPGEVVCLCHI